MANQTEKKRKPFIRKLVNYEWITKRIGLFLFLAALAIVYIANGHWADKTMRDISKNTKEIKDLQFEYKTLKSELMFQTRESELVKTVQAMGLKPSDTPPMHIKTVKETAQ